MTNKKNTVLFIVAVLSCCCPLLVNGADQSQEPEALEAELLANFGVYECAEYTSRPVMTNGTIAIRYEFKTPSFMIMVKLPWYTPYWTRNNVINQLKDSMGYVETTSCADNINTLFVAVVDTREEAENVEKTLTKQLGYTVTITEVYATYERTMDSLFEELIDKNPNTTLATALQAGRDAFAQTALEKETLSSPSNK